MSTITPLQQFLNAKHEEARRAAPHADVRLVPEAEGYIVHGPGKETQVVPLEKVGAFIRDLTRTGHSVALLDKVRLSAHGGWKLIEIATIPATGPKVEKKPQDDDDFA